MVKIISLIIYILVHNLFCLAQINPLIDSLENELKKAKDDTSKANILYLLSKESNIYDAQKALNYANQALSLSTKLNYSNGIAYAYVMQGNIKHDEGDFLNAMELHNKALNLFIEKNNKKGMGQSYMNLGNVFASLRKGPESIEKYFKALKLFEEINDKKRIASTYCNIASVYTDNNNFSDATRNFLIAIKIFRQTNSKYELSLTYYNIGTLYTKQLKDTDAQYYYEACLKISLELNNKLLIGLCNTGIANVYQNQKNHHDALRHYTIALNTFEDAKNTHYSITTYLNLIHFYIDIKNYNLAYQYANKSLELTKQYGEVESFSDIYKALSKLDSITGNFQQSFQNYKLYILYRDSIVNKENTKKITQQQMQFDFDKKESLAKVAQEKKNATQKIIRISLSVGLLTALFFSTVFFRQRNKISKEKKISEFERERSENLLLNILPSEVAEELKQNGSSEAKQFEEVTVLFTDFKDFSKLTENMPAKKIVEEIHECFKAFDRITEKYMIEKIKTIGDSYMCAGGLPISNNSHPWDVVNAGLEIQAFIAKRIAESKLNHKPSFQIRIGIHTGPVVAGIVGVKKFAYDIWGDTVNTASRMESSGEPGKVNISQITYELVKDKFLCTHRGKIQAKNKGELDMFFVDGKI